MKQCLENETPDGLMLYDPDSDSVHALNATGKLVYRRHAEGRHAGEIAAELQAMHPELDAETAERDVRLFLAKLQEKDLA